MDHHPFRTIRVIIICWICLLGWHNARAQLQPSDTSLCQNTGFSITADTSGLSGGPFSYAWSATPVTGQISCGTCQSATLTAHERTNYTLQIRDSSGTLVATDSIIVHVVPSAHLSISNSVPCAGIPTSISVTRDTTYAISSFTIDWGDGSTPQTGTGTSPTIYTHTYDSGGFTIVYQVTGPFGGGSCTTVDSFSIFNYDTPYSGFYLPGLQDQCVPELVCVGMDSIMLSKSDANTTYQVGFGTDTLTINYPPPSDSICNTLTECASNLFLWTNVSNGCWTQAGGYFISVYTGPTVSFSSSTTAACAGDSITFQNTSTFCNKPGSTNSFSWDFGNGNTLNSNASTVGQTFNTPGTYVVRLIGTNSQCGSDTAYDTICITSVPTAQFALSETSGCGSYTVNVSNTSTSPGNCGFSNAWSFSSGVSITSGNASSFQPTYQVSASGTAFITLIVQNACGSDTAMHSLHLSDTISGALSPITSACGADSITPTLTGLDTGGVSTTITWAFPGGTPGSATGVNPGTITYGSTGTKTITVTLINACDTDVWTTSFAVHPLPSVNVNAAETLVCAGALDTLWATGALTYAWSGSSSVACNNSTCDTLFATVNDTTTYHVTGTDSNGCTASDSITVIADTLPNIGIPHYLERCPYDTVFQIPNYGPAGGIWNGTSLSGPDSIDPQSVTPGGYELTYTVVGANQCANTDTLLFQLHPLPGGTISFTPTCVTQTITFTGPSSGITHWIWDFENGNLDSSGAVVSYVYASVGTDTLSLELTSDSGCIHTIDTVIQVDSVPVASFTFDIGCLNAVSTFNSTAAGNPDSLIWNFGDGSSLYGTGAATTAHTYTFPDTFDVTLTALRSASMCADDTTHTVILPPNTIPGFTFPDTICHLETVLFTNTTLGVVDSTAWDFGDGNTDTAYHPQHTYGSANTWNVQLATSNDSGCWDTVVQSVVIHPLPDASFAANDTCLNDTVYFLPADTGHDQYAWDFDDLGASSSQVTPEHVFSTTGLFDVTLLATTVFGCQQMDTTVVETWPNPVANMHWDPVCYGDTTPIWADTAGIITWDWWIDSNITTAGSSVSYLYADTAPFIHDSIMYFPVSLLATNGYGCTDEDTLVVQVYPRPIVQFTVDSGCALQHAHAFTNTSLGSLDTILWSFGDGNTATSLNAQHTYAIGDSIYQGILDISNSYGCAAADTQPVVVHGLPTAQFTADTACFGSPTTFTDQSTAPDSIVQYTWFFGDGNNSFAQHPVYQYYGGPGTYACTLVVETVWGCLDSIMDSVLVLPIPAPDFNADTVCPNTFTHFQASPLQNSTNDTLTYTWHFTQTDSLITQLDTASFSFDSAGIYPVTLTVTNGVGCSVSATKAVHVQHFLTLSLALPDTLCETDSLLFQANASTTSGSITNYHWVLSNGWNTNTTSSTIQTALANPGVHDLALTVTTNEGCMDSAHAAFFIDTLPSAAFTSTGGCNQTPIPFSGYTPQNTYGYYWDFGYTTSLDSVPNNIAFDSAGVYPISRIVTDLATGCRDSHNIQVKIFARPQPHFTFDQTCLGVPTQFESTVAFDTVYDLPIWSFDTNATIITYDTVLQYEFTYATTYTVSLTVNAFNGCTGTFNAIVPVSDSVRAGMLLPDTMCAFVSYQFLDNSTPTSGLNYHWDFGDGGSSTMENPTPSYGPGHYQVKHTVWHSISNCRDSVSDSIIVFPRPEASIHVPDPCVGDTIWMQSTSSISSGFIEQTTWYMGATPFGSGLFAGYPFDAGTHLVRLFLVSDAGCDNATQLPVTIRVYDPPTPQIGWRVNCNSLSLYDSSRSAINNPITRWAWTVDGSPTDTNAQIEYNVASQADSLEVSLLLTTQLGCNAEGHFTVPNYPLVERRNRWFPSTQPVCTEVEFIHRDSSLVYNAVKNEVLWDFDDGDISTDSNGRHAYADGGTYWPTMTLFYADSCEKNYGFSDSTTVYARPGVRIESPTNGDILREGDAELFNLRASDNCPKFQTTWSGSLLEGIEPIKNVCDTSIHKVLDYGTDTLALISIDLQTKCISSETAIIHVKSWESIYFPNAFTPDGDGHNDTFKIVAENIIAFEMTIWDRWGREVFKTKDVNEGWDGKSNGTKCPIGVYAVQIHYILENASEFTPRAYRVTLLR